MARKHEFPELAGKTVEAVNVLEDQDGDHQFEIRFQDRTGFAITLQNKLVIESAELRNWEDGEGELIKKFV